MVIIDIIDFIDFIDFELCSYRYLGCARFTGIRSELTVPRLNGDTKQEIFNEIAMEVVDDTIVERERNCDGITLAYKLEV